MIALEAASTWAGVITVFMTTVGAIILALIKKDSTKTKAQVAHINKAVNNVEDGEPTLIQRVTDIKQEAEETKEALHTYQAYVSSALQVISAQLGVKLPPFKQKE